MAPAVSTGQGQNDIRQKQISLTEAAEITKLFVLLCALCGLCESFIIYRIYDGVSLVFHHLGHAHDLFTLCQVD